jgi:hypothetical protein
MRHGQPNLVRIWMVELSETTVSDLILSLQ